jgi:hypothetical protein
MTDGDSPDEYYRTIEAEFVRRRGASMLLSPRDWALIGDWQKAGIPLRIVLQGIDNVFDAFDRRPPAARRINSLSYCRQEVLSLQELSLHLQAAGAGRPGFGEDTSARDRAIARHLGRLARSVREAMATASQSRSDSLVGALAMVSSELKRLRREVKQGAFDPARWELELGRLDQVLIEGARSSLSKEEDRLEETLVDKALSAERARMTPEAYGATRKALLGRSLRARYRLPRLTLFE